MFWTGFTITTASLWADFRNLFPATYLSPLTRTPKDVCHFWHHTNSGESGARMNST